MATATAPPGDYECPVCHENFSAPKILPCTHLLCCQCLLTLLKADGETRCPLCRELIAGAQEKEKKTCEEIADSLSTDVAMQARVECISLLTKPHDCSGCQKSEACTVCLHCGDMFCTNCATVHRNMSATQHHQVRDMASMTVEDLAFTRQLACNTHPHETSELFCPTHGAAICPLCATFKHRTCPDVKELDGRMEEVRAMLKETVDTLKAGEVKVEEAIVELDRVLLDMEKVAQATLDDIREKCDRLQRSLDECRQRLTEQTNRSHSQAREKAGEVKDGLLKRRGEVTSHLRLVERVGDRMPRACAVSKLPSELQSSVKRLNFEFDFPADLRRFSETPLAIDEEAIESLRDNLSQTFQLTAILQEPSAKHEAGATADPQGSEKSASWEFHTNRGANIVLSTDRKTAERVRDDSDAVVASSEAMQTDTLYEVCVEAVERGRSQNTIWCGVLEGHLDELPSCSLLNWADTIVIHTGGVWKDGTPMVKSKIGATLRRLKEGSTLGVLVDSKERLHLYVNGVDEGVAFENVCLPCHAFFNVYGVYKKIKTLPLKKIS